MRYFTQPTLLPTLLFILVFPVLIALGCWQLDRAQQKKQWVEALAEGKAYTLSQALADPLRTQYSVIVLKGEFLKGPSLLLMHQSHQGKAGVHLVNLFKIAGEDTHILVNRGFLANQNPTDIPPPPGQPMALRGIIDTPKPDRFILGDNILDPGLRPLPIQRIDVEELEAVLGLKLYPLVILADQDLGDGLSRDWQITPRMPPEKHLGYAVQWFALALCLAVIYIVVHLKKRPS